MRLRRYREASGDLKWITITMKLIELHLFVWVCFTYYLSITLGGVEVKTIRLLPLPILMLNIITKPLFYLTQPFWTILSKMVDSRLADRILAKLLEKSNNGINR